MLTSHFVLFETTFLHVSCDHEMVHLMLTVVDGGGGEV